MRASERSIILPITIGSMFEWFEVFLYNYWAPLMSESFFNLSLPLAELIHAVLILSTGFIARPIGGLLFGYIGDRWGRRTSFLISIIAISIPSLAVAFMPSFSSWAYGSLVYLGLMRFFQGIPAGGELSGALCLLSEGASPERKRYVCSYLFVGPQIGQIFSMLLCFSLVKNLSHEQLVSFGWRLSFLISGIIGVIGFLARRRLHESKAFETLKIRNQIELHPLRESFNHHKKMMAIALFLGVFEVTGFFMIYFFLFENSKEILKISPSNKLLVYSLYLIALTIIMPIFGKIGNQYKNKLLFKTSAISILILSPLFYLSISRISVIWIFILLSLIIAFFCIQFSILPSFISDLFPTAVRFTCIGFSFNITDGVVGGIIPDIGNWLIKTTGNPASFTFLFPITAIIFLICLKFTNNESSLIKKSN